MNEHFISSENEYQKLPRAGFIPYTKNEAGEFVYLTMVASNPILGGPRPMLSKGKIENGESTKECSIREAVEELGLVLENIKGEVHFLVEDTVVLRSGTYKLTLYYAEIKDRWNFDKWGSETEYTEWMTLQDFTEHGRPDHIKYIRELEFILKNK